MARTRSAWLSARGFWIMDPTSRRRLGNPADHGHPRQTGPRRIALVGRETGRRVVAIGEGRWSEAGPGAVHGLPADPEKRSFAPFMSSPAKPILSPTATP